MTMGRKYTIRYDTVTHFFYVTLDESECICPTCHVHLSGHGTRGRWVYMPCGRKFRFILAVGICPLCHHVHTELPHFIRPYKHYAASIIEGVVDGRTRDICEADDSTIRRWRTEYHFMAPHIKALLLTILLCLLFLCGESLLAYCSEMRIGRHWFIAITPLLCAAGFFPCTQFACYSDS